MSLSKRKTLIYVLIAAAIVRFWGYLWPLARRASMPSPRVRSFAAVAMCCSRNTRPGFTPAPISNIKCIDCHLPNNNLANHLFWKSVEGVKDSLAFHTGRVSETIHISDHGAKVVLGNCQRCHAETISRIHEDRRCWDCHRRLSHKRTGAIETRTP